MLFSSITFHIRELSILVFEDICYDCIGTWDIFLAIVETLSLGSWHHYSVSTGLPCSLSRPLQTLPSLVLLSWNCSLTFSRCYLLIVTLDLPVVIFLDQLCFPLFVFCFCSTSLLRNNLAHYLKWIVLFFLSELHKNSPLHLTFKHRTSKMS